MTKHDYIILCMVVAGIITNFLGAAFTIARVRSLLKQQPADRSADVANHIGLPDFSFSFSALKSELRGVRSFHEFARVMGQHAVGHIVGATIVAIAAAGIAAAVMALL
jgi:hypothetical protein